MLKALRASTHPALPALGQPASTTRERSPGITWIREALNMVSFAMPAASSPVSTHWSRRIAGGRNKAGSAAAGMLLVKLFTQHSRCA